MASITKKLERQRTRRQQALVERPRRKSVFKLSEERAQMLQSRRRDMLNSLTTTSARSWIAKRLLENAIFQRTGGFLNRNE